MGTRKAAYFFVLTLASLVYCNHLTEASANNPSSNKVPGTILEEESDLKDRVSKIEAHNRNQDKEMSLLKTALEEERKISRNLRNRVSCLEDSVNILNGTNKIFERVKRPARLLPLQLLRFKNQTDDDENMNNQRFYGPATGCLELSKLGYTLNGFYLVRGMSNKTQIEVVECRFQQHKHKLQKFETRIGVVNVKSSALHFQVERKDGDDGYEGEKSEIRKIKFLEEVLNAGGGFDWENQLFRAPYTGVYSFSISGSKNAYRSTAAANILVKLNNEIIGESLSSAFTVYGGFSFSFVRRLKTNDTIELEMFSGKTYRLFFSGTMLEQDLNV